MEADDAEKPRFGCLPVARYVMAAVMTVLIVAVTLNTVKIIYQQRSRHDPVFFSVPGGLVYVRRAATHHPPALSFYLGVQVLSPVGDFRWYYAVNTTACLFDENTPTDAAGHGAIVCFHQVKTVEQRTRHYFLMEAKGTWGSTMNSSLFDQLYTKGGRLQGVKLRLEGTFVAERRSGQNTTTSVGDINYCFPLIISGPEADQDEIMDPRLYDLPCVSVRNKTKKATWD